MTEKKIFLFASDQLEMAVPLLGRYSVNSSLTIKNVTWAVIGKNSLQMSAAVCIYRDANKELITLTSILIVGTQKSMKLKGRSRKCVWKFLRCSVNIDTFLTLHHKMFVSIWQSPILPFFSHIKYKHYSM